MTHLDRIIEHLNAGAIIVKEEGKFKNQPHTVYCLCKKEEGGKAIFMYFNYKTLLEVKKLTEPVIETLTNVNWLNQPDHFPMRTDEPLVLTFHN